MTKPVVRIAEYDDGGDVIDLMGAMWVDVDVPYALPIRPHADRYIDTLIERGFVYVVDAGKDGESDLIGFVTYDHVVSSWNPDPEQGRIINNEFYIKPEYREGGVGDKLLDVGKELAAEYRCPFFFSISTGGNIYALGKWLELKGFTPIGGNFFWVPDPAS